MAKTSHLPKDRRLMQNFIISFFYAWCEIINHKTFTFKICRERKVIYIFLFLNNFSFY